MDDSEIKDKYFIMDEEANHLRLNALKFYSYYRIDKIEYQNELKHWDTKKLSRKNKEIYNQLKIAADNNM